MSERDPAAALVDPAGRPAAKRKAEDRRCPHCRAGEDRRGPSGGFGTPWTICRNCGYEFKDQPWAP
jgi:hypothetical protein